MSNKMPSIKPMFSGKLFVFEGADGVGKTTIAEEVSRKLTETGTDVLTLSFPGREQKTLGELVYKLHHNLQDFEINDLSPISLQALHVAAHIDNIETRIRPALAEGKTVILDRYWWSTIAYGVASGINLDLLESIVALEKTVWGNIRPEVIFLITCEKPFRGQLAMRQWNIVSTEYNNIAKGQNANGNVVTYNNDSDLNTVVSNIYDMVNFFQYKNAPIHQKQFKFQHTKEFAKPAPTIVSWAPTKVTEVFDTYWKFAAERQNIFFNRNKGCKAPWTADDILMQFKFTNAYRASDRVSQYLIRNVIYNGDQDPDEILFRILIFKTFNKIETWTLLEKELDHISWRDFNIKRYDDVLTNAQENKISIFSGAYIMPTGGSSFGHKRKHRNILELIQMMMNSNLSDRIGESKSMYEVFEILRDFPMIGDFLAYQYATDINYSVLTNFSEMTFVVPGPGAKDGLKKCFADPGGLNEIDLIKLVADRQEDEFSRLGLKFKNLWGRPLQLIDCQNLFCEVDKYSRVAHPEVQGITGRTRIKQRFRPLNTPIDFFYPPKWGINDLIDT